MYYENQALLEMIKEIRPYQPKIITKSIFKYYMYLKIDLVAIFGQVDCAPKFFKGMLWPIFCININTHSDRK